jgi:hypothetical protein
MTTVLAGTGKIFTEPRHRTASAGFRPHLEQSLSLIERAVPQPTAAIIDVGAGESTLVDDLLGRGYTNLTLLDVSRKAWQLRESGSDR